MARQPGHEVCQRLHQGQAVATGIQAAQCLQSGRLPGVVTPRGETQGTRRSKGRGTGVGADTPAAAAGTAKLDRETGRKRRLAGTHLTDQQNSLVGGQYLGDDAPG